MVEFYRKQDIMESTILKSNSTLRINDDILELFLDETNNWYTQMAIEFLVDSDNVMIYTPPGDDDRDTFMVSLCEYYFLKELFFSLSKQKDDIYWIKYLEITTRFNNTLGKMDYNRIIGIKPAEVRTSGDWMTIHSSRG